MALEDGIRTFNKREGEKRKFAEGSSPEASDMNQKTRAYMKEHNVDYTTAFNTITQ